MANWGSGATGAASGAAAGSTFGPVGTAAGAVIGGIAGLFGSKKKKKKSPKRVSAFDPMQEGVYKDQVDALRGQGQFADLYNYDADVANSNFDMNVANPANRQFQEDIIPQITGQFRGNNLQNSTYAGEGLAKAGRQVQEGLNAARSQMHYQGQNDVMNRKANAIENTLNRSTFAYQRPEAETPNMMDQIMNSVGPAAGKWLESYMNKRMA